MTAKSKTIVFFGSGPVAARSLELLAEEFTVEAVITKPRPSHHRGTVPVLDVAQKLQLPTLTTTDRAALTELFGSHSFTSPVGVVIDYGIIIDQSVIDAFPLGIVNSHFSLLPQWRGADPITFSILSGQTQTGVSLMVIVQEMDQGPLIAQATYDIEPTITTPELTDDLIELSAAMLKQVLPDYIDGQVVARPQLEVTMAASKEPSYSRKLTKEDGLLDWQKTAEQLEREVRAYSGWPKSRTILAGNEVIITHARVDGTTLKPGQVVTKNKQLLVGTAKGSLAIERLKPAGKPEMSTEAFLAGRSL